MAEPFKAHALAICCTFKMVANKTRQKTFFIPVLRFRSVLSLKDYIFFSLVSPRDILINGKFISNC